MNGILQGTVFTWSPNVLEEVLKHQDIEIKFPNCALFSSDVSNMLQALRALALGCDLLPGGIQGVGIKSPLLNLDYDDLILKSGLNESLVKEVVTDLLKNGDIFEPKPGKLKILG